MSILGKQDTFGPRMNKNMLVVDKHAEKTMDQTDSSSLERNEISSHSTCNTSIDKELPNFNSKQQAIHDEFYTQICHPKQNEDQKENITDEDLQSIYKTDEEVEEGVLKQIFSLEFNNIHSKEQAIEYLNSWATIKPALNDESRSNDVHKEGGKKCQDKVLMSTMRSVAKEVIKQIGRKLISGDFNLTTISFPIRGKKLKI